MKLSIRLVTLLAGMATGSPFDKRQTDPEADQSQLKDYCAKSGLQAGIIKPIGEEADKHFMGTCLRNKDDFKLEDGPSLEDNLAFCKKLGRGFGGSAVPDDTGDYTIWCKGEPVGTGDAAADEEASMRLFNEIISESKDGKGKIDGEKVQHRLQALAKDAPGTVTGMYNALNARPSSAKTFAGLGGSATTVAGTASLLHSFIMSNVGKGGLIGPETGAGRWLRINPFYGSAGTQPSPFGIGGAVSIDRDSDTHLCVPFKDESRWYWSTDVTRCKSWHDRQECDTSYAYDAATKIGKEHKKTCDEERWKKEDEEKEKKKKEEEEKKKKEEEAARTMEKLAGWAKQSWDGFYKGLTGSG
ncbi:uncharacterized protein BBA_04782 [Beauveria bassiana ARSEF 2860]|uniref:Uncharacterized protein n=1 Tax=Beauveria bassiana (strain ARSEF 2860) TaxID=655819 RepID=J4KNU0_BEAB2|nr:uncharacterized protein BBA_04782 [Beauveria bassiana ARSEF 2860]EJP66289.1 hypothetical protein BBA_04782 [Beauveria bassiana ARSEF 2860]